MTQEYNMRGPTIDLSTSAMSVPSKDKSTLLLPHPGAVLVRLLSGQLQDLCASWTQMSLRWERVTHLKMQEQSTITMWRREEVVSGRLLLSSQIPTTISTMMRLWAAKSMATPESAKSSLTFAYYSCMTREPSSALSLETSLILNHQLSQILSMKIMAGRLASPGSIMWEMRMKYWARRREWRWEWALAMRMSRLASWAHLHTS